MDFALPTITFPTALVLRTLFSALALLINCYTDRYWIRILYSDIDSLINSFTDCHSLRVLFSDTALFINCFTGRYSFKVTLLGYRFIDKLFYRPLLNGRHSTWTLLTSNCFTKIEVLFQQYPLSKLFELKIVDF